MKNVILKLKVNTKVTYLILATNVIIWLAMEIVGRLTNSEVLTAFGALRKDLVVGGQWWRLVSCAFLHIGIIHLLINSYTLYQLGIFIESFFGQSKLIATYVITAITASLLSLALSNGISVSAGASGALFGLVGLLLGNIWAKKTYTPDLPIDETQLIPFVAYNLVIGFLIPKIDNWAHIGGLLGGIALGYIFDPAISFDPSKLKRIAPEILGKLSLVILTVSAIFWLLNLWGVSNIF